MPYRNWYGVLHTTLWFFTSPLLQSATHIPMQGECRQLPTTNDRHSPLFIEPRVDHPLPSEHGILSSEHQLQDLAHAPLNCGVTHSVIERTKVRTEVDDRSMSPALACVLKGEGIMAATCVDIVQSTRHHFYSPMSFVSSNHDRHQILVIARLLESSPIRLRSQDPM